MTSIQDTVMAAVAATVTPGGNRRQSVPAAAPATESQGSRTGHADDSVRQVEAYLQAHDRSVKFAVDHETGLTIVSVLNESTGEVVRQIPSEVTVRIAQYFDAMQAEQNIDEVV